MGGFKDPREYSKEKWVLELCDAYEKKYGTWETDSVNWIAGWFALMTRNQEGEQPGCGRSHQGVEWNGILDDLLQVPVRAPVPI